MKKDYVITEISAAQDGSPYVFVSLKGPKEIGGPQRTLTPPVASFQSMDEMVKNISRVFSKQMMGGFATVIKLDLDEYEKLDIKVGDKVSLEITKIKVEYP
jgi:hypothetical protein